MRILRDDNEQITYVIQSVEQGRFMEAQLGIPKRISQFEILQLILDLAKKWKIRVEATMVAEIQKEEEVSG